MRNFRLPLLCASAICIFVASNAFPDAPADKLVYVAVASNFAVPLDELSRAFQKTTGHVVKASAGSTGKLVAQIKNGGPFDVLLSADTAHVDLLIKDRLADDSQRFTYAIGRLALYAPGLAPVNEGVLTKGPIKHLAIANPETAPYGAAAMEALRGLGMAGAYADRIVTGENISQTLQFVDSGGAEAGFVAYAQVKRLDAMSFWLVPDRLHAPIRQDACLLRNGNDNSTAKTFLDFLRSKDAIAIIESYGYAVEKPHVAAK